MRVKIFRTQKQAMSFAHSYLLKQRIAGIRKLKNGFADYERT